MGVLKLAHGILNVQDLSREVEFYREVIGLHEIGKENGIVYLGCGSDNNYDLALKEGGSGINHFALQVHNEEDIAYYEKRLSELGVKTNRMTNAEPGEKVALRFQLPSGHKMELVVVENRPHYLHPVVNRKPSIGIAPLDSDHITLNAKDVNGLAGFLRDALDFSIADVFEPVAGVWGAAWIHGSDFHHDVAIVGTQDDTTLHHYAFLVAGIDEMKRACDILGQHGYKVETGPGRHSVGGNLYTYFLDPSGNRIELSAEMPRADKSIDLISWSDFPTAFSAWGAFPPESFGKGS
jgi:catechol 2,3-dioxygenase